MIPDSCHERRLVATHQGHLREECMEAARVGRSIRAIIASVSEAFQTIFDGSAWIASSLSFLAMTWLALRLERRMLRHQSACVRHVERQDVELRRIARPHLI